MKHTHLPDYLEFYRTRYGDHIIESHFLKASGDVGMFICEQPAGSYPDDPTKSYGIQLNIGKAVSGRLDLGAGQREFEIGSGTFIFSPPGIRTEYDLYGDHRIMCLALPADFVEKAATDTGTNISELQSLLTKAQGDTVFRHLLKECWKDAHSGLSRGKLYSDACLMMLATRLMSLAARGAGRPRKARNRALSNQHYKKICEFVDGNIDNSIRITDLASLVKMSEYCFSRAFKARTGQSPYQWVIDHKLGRAESLLQHSKDSIADIAYATGFSSQAHLSALFSDRNGISPSKYRKSNR